MGHDTMQEEDIQTIYAKLKKGLGHELVNDDNVFTLIALAKRYGDSLLETELREWQSDCGGPRASAAG
ncbi:MAG: hypothetical protein EOP38_07155 [Rubrivivax sp.]|nr:MAG: hypothetical protein EOP38_07155 [Rubrivivax sp.]